jgi:uncharacterized protein (TIGR03435 family)
MRSSDSCGRRKKVLTARTVFLIAGLVCVAAAFAQANTVHPEFEVASVRRNSTEARPWLAPPVKGRFTAINVTLKLLIGAAWPLKISGGPSWVATEGYDVSALMPTPDASADDFKGMVQTLLRERFALRTHTETREAQVYVLLPTKGGLKLPDAKPEPCVSGWRAPDADPQSGCGGMNVTPRSIINQKISMQWFSSVLAGVLGRPVVNKTGFTGSFQVHLEFAPLAPDTESAEPSIFEALEKQLGLKLESQKGTEEFLVIDHVERPSEN